MKEETKKTLSRQLTPLTLHGPQGKLVYALCIVAAICSIGLFGFYTSFTSNLRSASGNVQYGPKKLTPEEIKQQLIEIDLGLKAFLNSTKPFTKFGPPVTGWDATRAKVINKINNSTTGVNPKPRIMLITSSHPKKCENKQGDQMLLKAIKNKMDYCRLHGIELYYNMDKIDDEMLGWWVKTFLTHMLMKEHPEIDWFWWMDSDAVFTDMTFELPLKKYENYNMVMHGWENEVYERRNWLGINAGVYLIRNCQWSMDMLHAWAPMSPKGATRDKVGQFLTRALPNRGKGEADDQSGLVYLMLTDKERWGSKIYLESSYYFQGYWKVLTERFEEMMEKYKPGVYGDDRWPFVTHFCGCEFCCGSINPEYTVDQCLLHMERAINFADNQVIARYGFKHKSLKSPEVEPVRKDVGSTNHTSKASGKSATSKKA